MPLTGPRRRAAGLRGNSVFIQGDVIRRRGGGGRRADQQQWLIDGVNASNMALEVPSAVQSPVEAVQEIRIQQSTYSAEYGNTSSGVVAMTTRRHKPAPRKRLRILPQRQARRAQLLRREEGPLRWNIFDSRRRPSGTIRLLLLQRGMAEATSGRHPDADRADCFGTSGDFSQTFTAPAPHPCV